MQTKATTTKQMEKTASIHRLRTANNNGVDNANDEKKAKRAHKVSQKVISRLIYNKFRRPGVRCYGGCPHTICHYYSVERMEATPSEYR